MVKPSYATSSIKVLVRVLEFLLPAWQRVLLTALLGMATITAGIGLIGTSAWLISTAALQPSISVLQVAIVGVRFFGLSRGVLRYLERLVAHDTNFRILGSMRLWFYRRLEPLAPAGLLNERGGDLLTRVIDDIDTLELIYIRVAGPALTALLVVLGMGWFVGRYSTGLAGLLVGLLIIGGVFLPLIIRVLSRRASARQVEQRASLNAFLVESLEGLAELLLFDRTGECKSKLENLDRAYTNTGRQMAFLTGMQTGLSQLLGNLACWLALIWLIPQVSSGLMDGVMLAVLALTAAASFEAVAPLPAAAQYLDGSLAAARRLYELSDRKPVISETLYRPTTSLPKKKISLRVKNLTMSYADMLPPTLNGISFELPAGKKLAVVGENGSGKTSLTNILLRLWDYQSGELTLDGIDLRTLAPEVIRSAFSVAAQSSHLFDSNLLENITFGRKEVGQRELGHVLSTTCLDEFVSHLPYGLETPVGVHGFRLSGGERQRVTLARTLLRPSPILILDEPFSQLDRKTACSLLWKLLNTYTQHSLIYITHEYPGLESMDEILILHAGQIIERGTHHDLLKAGGIYSRNYSYQQESINFIEQSQPKRRG